MTISTQNLASYAVRDDNGNIDINQTLRQFTNDMTELVQRETAEIESVGEAVKAVFDEHENELPDMETLGYVVAMKLGADVASISDISSRAKAYVRRYTDQFEIGRGRGAGVRRIALAPEPKPAPRASTLRPPKSTSKSGQHKAVSA